MIRFIYVLSFMALYLIYSVPNLIRMKKIGGPLPVEEKDRKRHAMAKRWAKGIIKRTGTSVAVSGEAYIPDGPVLFVSNHEGDFDIPVLLGYIGKPFGFMSKIEVKKVPIISGWMDVLNCVFVDRKNKRQSVLSLRECIAKLKDGHSLVVFPEGTRSKGRGIADFKTGAFRIALEAGVPVVPIHITGTADIYENQKRGLKPASVKIDVLPAVPLSEYQGMTPREMADFVKGIIENSKLNKAS
ncbi:lysophospholipid acyltransferase family protein [Bacillus sp. P14.5]|uniref:lysophospholipid acyltransferase family protein n=1 Tax=Bacillus sp. P14.5 TaxID=1983400 RepID=UPI000DE981F3|nr:lysophospholipid acyltransferase family protein [Bacillus sp. P14.5]